MEIPSNEAEEEHDDDCNDEEHDNRESQFHLINSDVKIIDNSKLFACFHQLFIR